MENLNAEQIVKALECCTRGRKSNEDRPCLECPYNECNIVGGTSERQIKGTCQGWLMKDALALIKSQEQRIKEHDEERTDHISMLLAKDVIINDLNDKHNRLTKENKRLRAENEALAISEVKECEISQMLVYRIRNKHPAVMTEKTIRKTISQLKQCSRHECRNCDLRGQDFCALVATDRAINVIETLYKENLKLEQTNKNIVASFAGNCGEKVKTAIANLIDAVLDKEERENEPTQSVRAVGNSANGC